MNIIKQWSHSKSRCIEFSIRLQFHLPAKGGSRLRVRINCMMETMGLVFEGIKLKLQMKSDHLSIVIVCFLFTFSSMFWSHCCFPHTMSLFEKHAHYLSMFSWTTGASLSNPLKNTCKSINDVGSQSNILCWSSVPSNRRDHAWTAN